MHFAEKLDRFISNAGNTFSRSEAKKFKPEVNALGFFICVTPHTEPTAWDPSAIEPTLPYPHIARLSRAFLFSGPGNHHRHAFLLNRPEGLPPFKHTAPAFKPEVRDYENA